MDDNIPEPDRIEGAPHPRHTAQIFGQAKAEAAFLSAYNQRRLHHAWLISGPRGVGKATLAWRIARFLLSQPVAGGTMFDAPAPTDLTTPEDHPVARRLAALGEPRLFLCRRPYDHKTSRLKKDITVDEVRKLKGFFNLSAADGGRRVVLIDAADEMNTSAANALLKLLEEPPKDCILLLVSHRPMRLLPTIRSRCRVLKCDPLSPEDLGQALAQAGHAPGKDPELLAQLSEGSVGEALRLLSLNGLDTYTVLRNLLAKAPGMDRTAMLTLAEGCVGKNAEARYDLTLRLLAVLLHELAKLGVEQRPGATLGPLSPNLRAARIWANLAQQLEARAAHGRAVNLDPASVILDMLMKIDQTAGQLQPA